MGSGAPAAERLGARRAQTGLSLFLFSELLVLFSLLTAEAVRRIELAQPGHPAPWAAAGLTASLVAGWMLAQSAGPVGTHPRRLALASLLGVGFLVGQAWLDARAWEEARAGMGIAVAVSAFHLLHVAAAAVLVVRSASSAPWREGVASLWTFVVLAQLMIFTFAELL